MKQASGASPCGREGEGQTGSQVFIDGEDDLSYQMLCHQSGQRVYFENGAGI